MDALRKIERIYAAVCAENDEPQEQAGLTPEAIQAAFRDLSLTPPGDVAALYRWHDGIYHVNAFLHFLSLADAARNYRSLRDFKRKHEDVPWELGWFPVLDMNGDIQICLDIETGALHCVDIEMGQSWQLAEHYDACLDALVEGFESGAFKFQEVAGAFEATPRWDAIAAKFNVGRAW